ncbi:U11/U12 small nuclear ribonucleoprotein 48 kDa protein [Anarrhichthys ocellatus]|uniref:U11/U12 small nuclear ribonucleoprotein 48 kDa protein n=1 Tax=Anarrhichthys ocellatus TaxID=433405 RepID=UPI0012ECBFA7|nr:U11/U12 small nuclear ribonucleoprotein 48 kDa protein [Anarrhichthys ocellatus]
MSDSLETQTLQDRLDRLQELTDFTENCKKQLNDVFETLGWSKDYKQDAMEQCPYDSNHRVPVTSMEKHKASCSRRKMGYSAEEEAEMFDPSVCYENNSVRSFTMDKLTQHQVILQARSAAPLMRMEGVFWQGQYSGQPVDVPQNHKRAVCDLTVADRLALFDHVVSQRKEAASSSNEDLYVDLVSKLQRDEEQNEPKTHLELMAEMRDYKRRRQSYRAKNVHITKKSYTEVIREVINVHSGELTRQWREEEDEEESTRSELSSHRRQLDEKRSASSDSRHSRRRRSRERSPDRESKKKRKKRERDSCSPDEHHHHHDRKKKKKKKREEREKEK